MKKISKIFVILLMLTLAFSLFACGALDGDDGDTGEQHECEDKNIDGKCDECGESVPLPPADGTVNLVSGGKPNFQIIVGSDAVAQYDTIEKFLEKLNARLEGDDIMFYSEAQSTEQEIEILIGTVNSRGSEYALDKYSYGESGYGVEIIGRKIVVVGGSDAALKKAIEALERDVFGIAKAVTPITDLTVTESIHKPYTDYKIESVSIDGKNIREFVIATDNTKGANDLARTYQQLFYKHTGVYMDIVRTSRLEEGQKAIKIAVLESGDERCTEEGFNAYVSGGDLVIECEFPNKLEETASELFKREIINSKNKKINFASNYSYKVNVRIITYEQFGAVGDGDTDDFAAIRAAHEYANEWGHEVHATNGKIYYIGNSTKGKSISIKTNTYWNGAKFIFDDSKIAVHSSCGCVDCAMRNASIFVVGSSGAKVTVTEAVKENLPLLNSFDGAGTQKFENWHLDYDALVYLQSNERKVFIRMGANADSGDNLNEVILVRKDGTIDPSTPLTWDYSKISTAYAYNAEETPIVIDGGGAIIETIANRPTSNAYISFSRNISVQRSNTTVRNFTHIVQEEQEFRAPYAGILYTSRCNNTTYENIVLQAARRKFVEPGNQQGTYEIGANTANDIKFINVNVSNFFATGAAYDYSSYGVSHKQGQVGNRGMMGTNYCRNFYFKNCRIVNFDAHKGMGNLTIENCELQNILVMGSGNIVVKDTVCYADNSKTIISYRLDYGASFRGNIELNNIEMKYSTGSEFTLIKLSYSSNNDYDTELNAETGEYEAGKGSTNYMGTNIYAKNIKVTKYKMINYIEKNEDGYNDIDEEILTATATVCVLSKSVSTGYEGSDISKFKSEGGYSDKNRYIAPETIVIENSYYNIKLPSSTTFRRNTKMFVDGEEVQY